MNVCTTGADYTAEVFQTVLPVIRNEVDIGGEREREVSEFSGSHSQEER